MKEKVFRCPKRKGETPKKNENASSRFETRDSKIWAGNRAGGFLSACRVPAFAANFRGAEGTEKGEYPKRIKEELHRSYDYQAEQGSNNQRNRNVFCDFRFAPSRIVNNWRRDEHKQGDNRKSATHLSAKEIKNVYDLSRTRKLAQTGQLVAGKKPVNQDDNKRDCVWPKRGEQIK
ncbi:MAG: hypothetical protein NT157_04665 [Candidatus Micrarchaeota archaeon]|nr:hypothetical protein [Candidatus Micrarchaeota archaeon]